MKTKLSVRSKFCRIVNRRQGNYQQLNSGNDPEYFSDGNKMSLVSCKTSCLWDFSKFRF